MDTKGFVMRFDDFSFEVDITNPDTMFRLSSWKMTVAIEEVKVLSDEQAKKFKKTGGMTAGNLRVERLVHLKPTCR